MVWLKIDTGMHRLGVRPEQLNEFVERLHACPNVAKPLRYMSHFGCADELNSAVTHQQVNTFLSLTEGCRGERSLAASAGILAWPDSHLEWIRPGIIMYGGVTVYGERTVVGGIRYETRDDADFQPDCCQGCEERRTSGLRRDLDQRT